MKDHKFSRDSQATLERADKIIDLIVKDYGYEREQLRGEEKMLPDSRVSECRALCLYVISKTLRVSQRKRGAMFGMHHTGIAQYNHIVRDGYGALPWFRDKVDRIALLLYSKGLVKDPTVLQIKAPSTFAIGAKG